MKFVDYDARRTPKTHVWCCMCQRDLPPSERRRRVYLDGGMRAIHPQDMAVRPTEPDDFGWRPIGADCAKRLGLEWTEEAIADDGLGAGLWVP